MYDNPLCALLPFLCSMEMLLESHVSLCLIDVHFSFCPFVFHFHVFLQPGNFVKPSYGVLSLTIFQVKSMAAWVGGRFGWCTKHTGGHRALTHRTVLQGCYACCHGYRSIRMDVASCTCLVRAGQQMAGECTAGALAGIGPHGVSSL